MIKGRNYDAWKISEKKYPSDSDFKDQAIFLLRYASLSSSTFNAQPWKSMIKDHKIDVYLDRRRVPIASDKTGRFAFVSMGCFLETLSIAAGYYGWQTKIKLVPNSKKDLIHVASVDFSSGKKELSSLFDTICRRSTNRSMHTGADIPQKVIQQMSLFSNKDVRLILFNKSFAEKFVSISIPADIRIWGDKVFQKEHVGWVRHNLTKAYDGMPGFGVGVSLMSSFFARPVIMSPVFKKIQSKKNVKALLHSAHFGVLCSGDDQYSWINTGRLYQKLSLYLTSLDMAIAPMGQFIEDDIAREELTKIILPSTSMKPQIFFRFGYPSQSVHHSPRLPVENIILSQELE